MRLSSQTRRNKGKIMQKEEKEKGRNIVRIGILLDFCFWFNILMEAGSAFTPHYTKIQIFSVILS